MFNPQLLSANTMVNYVEKGDTLFLTLRWQNIGDIPFYDNMKIVVDVEFCDRHRIEENKIKNFQFSWEPFPDFSQWDKGEIINTTGAWKIPEIWGGSYSLNVSLKKGNGEIIRFIGENGKLVYSQKIFEIDVGWGWGKKQLLLQRKLVDVEFNKAVTVKFNQKNIDTYNLGLFKLNSMYPSACGFEKMDWHSYRPIIRERNVSSNNSNCCVENVEYKVINIEKFQIIYSFSTENIYGELAFCLEQDKMNIRLENVIEKDGFELISVELPGIVQVCGEYTRFSNNFGGGREVILSKALSQSVDFCYDTCNTLAAYNSKSFFCVNTDDLESVLKQSVVINHIGEKTVVIGVKIFANIPADKKGMRSIPVKPKALEIHYKNNGDWQTAALLLQNDLPDNIKEKYKDTLIYKITCDKTGEYDENNPYTYNCKQILTLRDVEKIINAVLNISNNTKQVVYLVGWQQGGHDFEYPFPQRQGINKLIGTTEEFKVLLNKFKEKNVVLSFHDNFDDAYFSKNYDMPYEILCKDSNGHFNKGWLWAGGMSYIICPKAYIESGQASKRIKENIDAFGIESSYHLDVLSSEIRRYDFTQDRLLSAEDNLSAKFEIINKFNEYGIDVTSEILSKQFIGKIGYAQGVRYKFNEMLFYSEKFVPFTTVAFHGFMPYASITFDEDKNLLYALICGISECADIACVSSLAIKNIYLIYMPMIKLAYLKAIGAEIENSRYTVFYENNSSVTVDFDANSYSIIFNGNEIGYNFNTFLEREGNYYFYSEHGGEFDLKFPKEWTTVEISTLGFEGKCKIAEIPLRDGVCSFMADKGQPYLFESI